MSQPTWQERRESERLPAADLPHLSARLEGSREVRLIDVSRRGLQFETSVRLRPGTEVALRLVAGGEHITLTGRVVRSLVSGLDGAQLVYRTAVSFAQDIAFYGRPASEDDGRRPAASEVRPPAVAGPGAPATPAVFHVASSDVDARVQELLSANDW